MKDILTDDMLIELAEDIIGRGDQCLEQIFEERYPDNSFDDLTIEQLATIDEIVFTCDGCGWLTSADEKNDYDGNAYCGQCYGDAIADEDEELD